METLYGENDVGNKKLRCLQGHQADRPESIKKLQPLDEFGEEVDKMLILKGADGLNDEGRTVGLKN